MVAGRVVRAGDRDTTPVGGARVVLHRIGRMAQGPLDSARTDARGRFRFRFSPDSGSVFLVSAHRHGIEYFSPPLHPNPLRPDTALVLPVADTSADAPVAVEARHVVVGAPGEDGARRVLDLLVLRNPGDRTRVPPDSLRPSLVERLPDRAAGAELGESDFSPSAIDFRGESLLVFAPIAPGEKQVLVQYILPGDAGEVTLRPVHDVATLNLLLEETGVRVRAEGLAPADSQLIEGRRFQTWRGPARGGEPVVLAFRDPRLRWTVVLAALVGAMGLALVATAWRLRRRRVPAPATPVAQLLEAIARLDAEFQGREGEVGPEAWSRYREERGRLKGQLEVALAGNGAGS